MVFTGAFVYLQWGIESAFKGACCGGAANITTTGECFGFDQKITTWSFTNAKIPIPQLNDVRVKTYAYGQTRGTIGLDFILSSPAFLEIIGFKNVVHTGCASPFTHTWTLDTCGTQTSDTKLVQSFTLQVGQCAGECAGDDIVRTLTGGIVNSATLTTSIGETVKVTLDANYANEILSTTLDACLSPICVTDYIPYTFAHGTLHFPAPVCCPTVIAEVQDVSATFSQGADHIWGIGDSVANSGVRKLMEMTGSFKTSFTDAVQLQKLYAQQKDTLCNTEAGCGEALLAEQPTLRLTFTNGLAAANERSITFDFTGITLDDHSLNIDPNEPVFEDINWQARDCVVVAVDATAVIPAAAS